ncbi:MAG: SGNH/GDSL hydrolase family protein [bacterium]|nr:SGNH/GDSL hydrolase family protein [bacterium]
MNICIFGDSITWGAYDPQNGGWVNRLRNYFEVQDEDIDVYNLGISGDSTTDLFGNIEMEVIIILTIQRL